ncbi:MAG: ABC transporter permease [Elusimicrobia bacterium]|nr:ABC transporter permease [Elusimicrobiota bacterium]
MKEGVRSVVEPPLRWLGERFLTLAEALGQVTKLFRQTITWLYKVEARNVMAQMVEIGVRSFPVTSLTSLFTGMVLALQTGFSFRKVFNEPLYIGSVVGLSLVKELGPVLTAVVVAGRVGASIAAELGTMKVTEQLDALYTLGTHPVRYLAVPRFIACVTMVPLLTVYADSIGVLGGFFVAFVRHGVPSSVFWDEIRLIKLHECYHGLIKSIAFAVIIVVTACYKGFTCGEGAEGVGRATTSAVVVSMVLILVSDYFLSAALVALGIGR